MCQVAVYLDGKKIMEDVMLVEPVEDGLHLVKLFEPIKHIKASIRKIDLMKNEIQLESLEKGEG
jgi:predicted RNA-binding protein